MIDVHAFLANHLAKLTYNKHNQTYTACCPICREGDSWLKRKRFYFYNKTNSCYCFNCGYSAKLYKLYYDLTGKMMGKMGFENPKLLEQPAPSPQVPETQDWLDYRQALRDFPDNVNVDQPVWDIVWPTPPNS